MARGAVATAPTPSKSQLAYDFIKARIEDSSYSPGYRLVLGTIASELGVSVVPVREAVRLLEAEGLVLFERNVGARVFPRSRGRVLRARGSADALDDALARLERSAGPVNPLSALSGDDLVVLIGAGEGERADVIEALDLEVGVGPARPLVSLAESDEAARLALAAATPGRPVVDWTELTETGVDGLIGQSALHAFASELLEPIAERGDAEELLEALRAFLNHNGQVGPVSAALGVHRNTLRNRLDAAQQVLGRSLHDPQLRADLWIALKQQA